MHGVAMGQMLNQLASSLLLNAVGCCVLAAEGPCSLCFDCPVVAASTRLQLLPLGTHPMV